MHMIVGQLQWSSTEFKYAWGLSFLKVSITFEIVEVSVAYDTYSGHKRLLRSGIDLVPQLNACISFILNVTILAEYGDRMKGSRNSLGSVIFLNQRLGRKDVPELFIPCSVISFCSTLDLRCALGCVDVFTQETFSYQYSSSINMPV